MEGVPLMCDVEQADHTDIYENHGGDFEFRLCGHKMAWHSLKAGMMWWWKLTTSSTFLSSSISRRDFAHSFWMVLVALLISYDCSMGIIHAPGSNDFLNAANTTIVCLYCLLIGFIIALRQVSTRSLHFDVVIALCFFVFSISYRACIERNNYNEFCFVVVGCATGLHSSVLVMFNLLTIGTSTLLHQHQNSDLVRMFGMFLCYVTSIVEIRSAALLSQLEEKASARERLLDQVTDGFCEVDVASGVVTNASAKLECTLEGKDWLQGSTFSSLLCALEDQKSFEQLLVDASVSNELRSILVTCQISEGRELDAKLMPLPSMGGAIVICFQTLGELRGMPTAASLIQGSEQNFIEKHSAITAPTVCDELCDDFESVTGLSIARSLAGLAPTLSSLAYSHSCAPISEVGNSQPLLHDVGTQSLPIGTSHSSVQTDTSRWIRPPTLPINSLEAPGSFACKQSLAPQGSRRPSWRVALNSKHRRLHQFKGTPRGTLRSIILDLAEKSNLHGKGCCYWHIALMTIRQVVTEMASVGCTTNLSLHDGWQCHQCALVYPELDDEDGEDLCDFCGSARVSEADDSVLSSASKD